MTILNSLILTHHILTLQTLMRVCVLMVMRLAIVAPQLCHAEIIQPLAAPLLSVFACSADDDASEADVPIRTAYVYENYLHAGAGSDGPGNEITRVRDSAVLCDSLSLQSSVELLHLLVTLCPMHAALARALCLHDVDTAMLHLYSLALSARAAVSPQLFESVESFLVNLFKFGGSKMVARVERFVYDTGVGRSAWAFSVTKQGLVEVRMASEPVPSVSSMSQVLMAVKGDDREDEGKRPNAEIEVALQTVMSRLGAVTSLLLIFEESFTARHSQMDVTGAAEPSMDPPSSSSGKKAAPASEEGASGQSGQSGGSEYLGSELFLRSLSSFLRLTPAQTGASASRGVVDKSGAGEVSEALEKNAWQSPDPALSGAVVLELQEKLPFVALLRDGISPRSVCFCLLVLFIISGYLTYSGLQILRLLKTFLEVRDAQISGLQ